MVAPPTNRPVTFEAANPSSLVRVAKVVPPSVETLKPFFVAAYTVLPLAYTALTASAPRLLFWAVRTSKDRGVTAK